MIYSGLSVSISTEYLQKAVKNQNKFHTRKVLDYYSQKANSSLNFVELDILIRQMCKQCDFLQVLCNRFL